MMSTDQHLNILVTGSNGQLGRSIRKEAESMPDNYIFTDINELDITDEDAVRRFIRDNKINLIINCAAYTNVDAAEDDESTALRINGQAPGFLANAIREKNGFLIHISTDYVFGGSGKNSPITESQPGCPTCAYGRTKLTGEEEILKSSVSSIILRTAWLYSDYGNNFPQKILSLLEKNNSIKVVFDQCGTPTYASDLAKAIVQIVNKKMLSGYEGIYHYSNEGVCSWYDFAHSIVRHAGIKDREVLPCHSSEFPSKVTRPAYSVLDKTKFKETFGIKIPYWEDSLQKYLSHNSLLDLSN